MLKRIVIVDVIVIAVGFVLRAYIGGFAIGVEVSAWLGLVTFLLALFLALVRRRQELLALSASAATHRRALADHTRELLDQMIGRVTAATLVACMIYSVPDVTERLGTRWAHFTIPFVVFGMFRYLYLAEHTDQGEDPARVLLGDLPLQLAIVLWIGTYLVLLYGPQVLAALRG